MNLIIKIGKLLAIVILTVIIILVSASFLLKDKVGFIILTSLNKNLSTKLEVGSYRLSFLRKFPKASLELRNVLVHSSPGFNSAAFKGINTDTLLAAATVSLDFRLTDILRGNYTIERIGAKTGRANFFTDSDGHVNYNITVSNSSSSGQGTTIDLRKIYISDIYTTYNNLSAHLIIGGMIRNGNLKSHISGSVIDFIAGTEMQIDRFNLFDFATDKTIPAKLDINLQSSKSGMRFRKGILYIENSDLEIAGFVSSDNLLDLDVSGHNLDLSRLKKYLPEKYAKMVSGYDPSGIIVARSKIKGFLTHNSNPHVEIDFQFRNGKIAYAKSDLTFRNLSFDGHLSNGSKNRYSTSSVSITDFKGKLGTSQYTGALTLKDFNSPLADLSFKGRVFPGEIREFFNIRAISTAEGSVDLDLKITNCPVSRKSYSIDGLIDMKPESTLDFNSFTLGLDNDKILFSKVKGTVTIQNTIKLKNIQFNYRGQNVKADGEFRNFPEWISGRNVDLTGTADITFDKLIPEVFFDNSASAKKHGKPKALKLPEDIILDVNFRIDSLEYKTFTSSKIAGSFNYKPKMLTFKSIKMKSLNGLISGNCFLAQNSNKGFMAKGSFTVSGVDVNKAFTTFHNFGQSFLKAENIKGTLSGSLSLLFPLDSLLNFHINTLTAEGNYHLVNGALINFDPVKQLSRFIELSELENISFQQLDNDFFIRNNYLYIPQMEVKSSAVDLSVNGKHSFDNDYEYHVKMLLSEILSRKRTRYKSNVTEFGVVEDDGLGRTSLLLKILGKGEQAKVSYDMKAAGTQVKTSLKKEKQTLKTILNQEYGWYKNDSVANQKPVQKKSRVRITWDDGEAVKSTPDSAVARKKNLTPEEL
jgi:hypothetical protein